MAKRAGRSGKAKRAGSERRARASGGGQGGSDVERKIPRKQRTKADAPGAQAAAQARGGIGDNSRGSRLTPEEERDLFNQHRRAWIAWKKKEAEIEEIGIEVKAALKADGFKVVQMQIADDLKTPKGEKRVVDNVTDRLKVARWIGHPMGSQLDLFEAPDRTPSVDRAFDAGKQASMENEPRKPPHAPGTDAYDAWMNGYNAHQEKLAGGFKPIGETNVVKKFAGTADDELDKAIKAQAETSAVQ